MMDSDKAAGAHVSTGSAAAPAPEASSKLAAHPFFMKLSEKSMFDVLFTDIETSEAIF
jgi:hypothetical protein